MKSPRFGRTCVRAVALGCLALAPTGLRAQSVNLDDPAAPGADTPHIPSAADSLPAFKSDSLRDEPFRQLEAGGTPGPSKAPQTQAARDSVTSQLRERRPAISAWLGVSFIDLDAKEQFNKSLEARRSAGNLKVLQPYEPVHLAFPGGLQAILPVSRHFDLVAKTFSYSYTQNAILGDSLSRRQGDESFTLQANLAGVGLRYYVPPDLLSVSGSIALYAQGVAYWQVGAAEVYTTGGSASARFNPAGSGFELVLGFLKEVTSPWSLGGSLGFMQQSFASNRNWSQLVAYAAPGGKVSWSATSLQAAMNLWYHFGVKPPSVGSPGQALTPAQATAPPTPGLPAPATPKGDTTTVPPAPAPRPTPAPTPK